MLRRSGRRHPVPRSPRISVPLGGRHPCPLRIRGRASLRSCRPSLPEASGAQSLLRPSVRLSARLSVGCTLPGLGCCSRSSPSSISVTPWFPPSPPPVLLNPPPPTKTFASFQKSHGAERRGAGGPSSSEEAPLRDPRNGLGLPGFPTAPVRPEVTPTLLRAPVPQTRLTPSEPPRPPPSHGCRGPPDSLPRTAPRPRPRGNFMERSGSPRGRPGLQRPPPRAAPSHRPP